MKPGNAIEAMEWVSGGDPAAQPQASVVVLHGLGADGSDFVPIAQALELSAIGPVRFVFPSAPIRPVSINGGYRMRAWYDIHPPRPDGARLEDEAGLLDSLSTVLGLLEREQQRGVPAERTVLMGFSQGCAMTLLAGLRAPWRLAGLVALSGYLPLAGTMAAQAPATNRTTPVFMAHGEHDEVVVPARGLAARDQLRALGQPVQWHSYPIGHSVCIEEVRDLNAWLLRVLAPG